MSVSRMGGPVLSREDAGRIGAAALRLATADDAVVRIRSARLSVSRFSNNTMAQNSSEERCEVSLTVAFDGRRGTASIDTADESRIPALVERAERIARLTPPDPEFLSSLGPQEYLPVMAWSDRTAACTPEESAEMVRCMTEPARTSGLRASGTVELELSSESVLTRNGLFAYYRASEARAGCTMTGPDSSGWARDVAIDVSRLHPEELASQAIDQTLRSASPREIAPGRYTVLLMPAATGHMAEMLVWWANARLTFEGLTYLSERVGEKLAGEDVIIKSDPRDPDLPTIPFDEEGVPQRPVTWVDRGVFRELWWDRWTAQKHGATPVRPLGALSMEGSDRSLDELVAGIERGILVTHFWYIRSVKADQTLVTGMTRDGTFWIEDGKVRYGLKSMRFNESCLGMLQRVEAMGRPEICLGPEVPPCRFPPLVVRDWNFVGVTGI